MSGKSGRKRKIKENLLGREEISEKVSDEGPDITENATPVREESVVRFSVILKKKSLDTFKAILKDRWYFRVVLSESDWDDEFVVVKFAISARHAEHLHQSFLDGLLGPWGGYYKQVA